MKKVLVAYTNYDYLKYVKAWVRGARDVGKWDDDIVIIIPLEDMVKVQETMETSGLGGLDIKLFYAKPFTKDFYIHYYKLFHMVKLVYRAKRKLVVTNVAIDKVL